MPHHKFPGPCVACGKLEPTDYYRKQMCVACYKRSRRVPKPKKSQVQYSGPCINCGTFESANGRFIRRMCGTCYARIVRNNGNLIARTKYNGPCVECGVMDAPRYFRQMCAACYKRDDYARKVKSLRKFCSECNQEISRLSRTGMCKNCRHRHRYATDEKYRKDYLERCRKYLQTQKGKLHTRKINRKRRIQKFGTDIHITEREWQSVLKFYGNRCAYCGCKIKGSDATQDHVVPLANGGTDTIENIVPACRSCNAKKGKGLPLKPVQVLLIVDLP